MNTRSAKNKGQRLSRETKESMCETLELSQSDVRVVPAGVCGMDLWLSEYAQTIFPFAVECKNQENISIWKCLEQAKSNSTDTLRPLLVFRRNRSATYACLEFETLLGMCKTISGHEASPILPF